MISQCIDHLQELLRHVEGLKQNPAGAPWNYRDRPARLAAPAAA
jgi:hypothetical protein